MLSKNISQKGIEFVESTLAYPPERRIEAKEALGSAWIRPPPLPSPPVGSQEPERSASSPPPLTLGLPPPSPAQSPLSFPREQSTSGQHVDTPRPSGSIHSIDQRRPVTEFVAQDIDLREGEQWWRAPGTPPPALQDRITELYFEIDEFYSSPRGGGISITKHAYVLFHDYSQTVITARYDRDDPINAALKQRHSPPPPIPRQDLLEDFQVKYGANIYIEARLREGTMVQDGDPYAFIREMFSHLPNALSPVGCRAYGALVYANLANNSVLQNDMIRAGDILTFQSAEFRGFDGGLGQKYTLEVGKPDHVAVVVDWDGTKKEVRAYEQGRESREVKMESFVIGDLRSGEVKVWRVVGRDWIGWGQEVQPWQ